MTLNYGMFSNVQYAVLRPVLMTNLVVVHIVEAIVAKERAKLFCLEHPAKECQFVCTDCCEVLCVLCVTKGEHMGHTIDDIDDAMVTMKKRLTTSLETKIANLEKAIAAKVDKLKRELAQQEQYLNTVTSMITEAMNNWKTKQLQAAQQAIDKELEASNTEKASWKEKYQLSNFQDIMTACKEAETEEISVTDAFMPKVNLAELFSFLCDAIQTLIEENQVLQSSLSLPPSTPEDTDENHISWDFIAHLCSSAVPQNDPSARPYIPPCVKRVANMYDRSRNMQFLSVVLGKWEGEDTLICRTDDFVFQYVCSEREAHTIDGVWDPSMRQVAELLERGKDVLHDPEHATEIENAMKTWVKGLVDMRDGEHEPWWEVFE